MGFVCYVTVLIFIDNWFGLQSSAGTLNALILSSMASLCLFCFSVSVITDPAHVPSSYVPDVEETAALDQEPHKNSSRLRQCDKCCTYKHPRTNHCRVCRRCILRMGHHCLWINNCVGYWNHNAFFTLVLYATVASIYSMVMIICSAVQKDQDFSGRLPLKISSIFSGLLMSSSSITLGSFLAWHVYLITHNVATIEYHEGIQAAWLARKSRQSCRHPYDLSAYKNITSVLVTSMLKWLYQPTISHLKDGMSTSCDS